VGVHVGDSVNVGLDVAVHVGDSVNVGLDVAVHVGVSVGVSVGELVSVNVNVSVSVGVHVCVLVSVHVGVSVGVYVGEYVVVSVGVSVGESVVVNVGVSVGELVGVLVGVNVGVVVDVGVLHITSCEYPPLGTGHWSPFTALKYVSLGPPDIALNVIVSKFGLLALFHPTPYVTDIELSATVFIVPPILLAGIPVTVTPPGIVITRFVIGPSPAACT